MQYVDSIKIGSSVASGIADMPFFCTIEQLNAYDLSIEIAQKTARN